MAISGIVAVGMYIFRRWTMRAGRSLLKREILKAVLVNGKKIFSKIC